MTYPSSAIAVSHAECMTNSWANGWRRPLRPLPSCSLQTSIQPWKPHGLGELIPFYSWPAEPLDQPNRPSLLPPHADAGMNHTQPLTYPFGAGAPGAQPTMGAPSPHVAEQVPPQPALRAATPMLLKQWPVASTSLDQVGGRLSHFLPQWQVLGTPPLCPENA